MLLVQEPLLSQIGIGIKYGSILECQTSEDEIDQLHEEGQSIYWIIGYKDYVV